jgi:osmoprotectant transport system substrate-binding protein/osmoprotectant transport system permease protein
MDERIAAAWARLPDYLGAHVGLSAAALLLGLAISVPLAIAASRSAALRWPLLTVASLIQTIPSLALLALFYPLLLGLSALAKSWFGVGFSALGFLPALSALTLYSMLPILRNVVVGLTGLAPDVIEAARGVGMTPRQSLLQVELPLAAPVILAGVRTSAVWVIGAATLSTPIGQTSLGNYIFTGLQTENWIFVLFGCAAAALLALAADQLLGLIESGLARRDRRRVVAGAAGLVLGALTAVAPSLAAPHSTYTIGAKTFSEQFILARLMRAELAKHGLSASVHAGLGSTVILRALAANDIDVYVDYSGTIWTNAMARTDNPGREEIEREVGAWLKRTYGITALGGLGFENAYALAMRRDKADALGAHAIADLAALAPQLKIGGDLEFFSRPEWAAIHRAYGLSFAAERQYQSTFMYRAVADGDVDVISAFSSDGRIASFDLVVLDDPKGAIPPYDALLLIAPARAHDEAFIAALQPLVGAIPVAAMRRANEMVDRSADKASPRAAAAALAREAGLD